MKKILSLAVLAVFMGTFGTAYAAEFIVPDKGNGNVTVPTGQPHKNLYTAGANVNVNSDTVGDLVTAGGVVNISAKVEGDLMATGGTVVVNGPVGSDARLAGGNVTLNSPIAGDLLAAGGNLNISSNSTIGGDLVVAGGNVSVDSPVSGKIMAAGGNITINSEVKGEVNVRADTSLTFGPNARVAGKITYKGPSEAVVKEGAQVSTIEFTKYERKTHGAKKFLAFMAIVKLIGLFLAAWFLSWYKKGRVAQIMEDASRNPMASLGLGLAVAIITPIVVGLLFITFVGYYLAFIVLFSYILLMILACVISAIYAGSLIVQWYKKSPNLEVSWASILLGVVVIRVLSWIPIVGWLAVCILALIILGSMARMLKRPQSTPPSI